MKMYLCKSLRQTRLGGLAMKRLEADEYKCITAHATQRTGDYREE